VILRGVSPLVNEKDFLVFADPKPVGAERFHGMPIVKLIFDSEELTKKALSSGVTFGHSHYRTEPFVDKRSAYCRKCKSLNKNHTECELRCGKCGESHVTKECPGEKIVCVNCTNPTEPHDSFHCPKVLKKERDSFQKIRKSYAETVGKPLAAEVKQDPQASVVTNNSSRYASVVNSLPSGSGNSSNSQVLNFQESLAALRDEFQAQLGELKKTLEAEFNTVLAEHTKEIQQTLQDFLLDLKKHFQIPAQPFAQPPQSSKASRSSRRSRTPLRQK
jgi:hypothetical protein